MVPNLIFCGLTAQCAEYQTAGFFSSFFLGLPKFSSERVSSLFYMNSNLAKMDMKSDKRTR